MQIASGARARLAPAIAAFLVLAAPLAAPAVAQPRAKDPLAAFASSLTTVPDAATLGPRTQVYVPAYATVRVFRDTTVKLATTLGIHNTAPDRPLVVHRVAYFDTAGRLLREYLDAPVALRPYATVEVFVEDADVRGGSGANFVVEWSGAAPIPEPAIEAVAIGMQGPLSFSLVSPGRPTRPAPPPGAASPGTP